MAVVIAFLVLAVLAFPYYLHLTGAHLSNVGSEGDHKAEVSSFLIRAARSFGS
jgi:hypothetical protein